MSAASNYLENALLAHFRGTRLPLPDAYYVALHTTDPSDSATAATEVSTNDWPAYARQPVGSPLNTAWTTVADETGGGDGMQIANANTIDFPANDGDSSVTVSYFSVWDAETGGNMWAHAELTTDKTIDPDDIFSVRPGALRLIVR